MSLLLKLVNDSFILYFTLQYCCMFCGVPFDQLKLVPFFATCIVINQIKSNVKIKIVRPATATD